MKRTQNEKILQIKFETLIVGIDVGKETHYARAFDFRGLELAKLLRFSNTRQGYESLENWMQEIMREHGKTEAIVGFEPHWALLVHAGRSPAKTRPSTRDCESVSCKVYERVG